MLTGARLLSLRSLSCGAARALPARLRSPACGAVARHSRNPALAGRSSDRSLVKMASETAAAKAAAAQANDEGPTIFDKIISGDIPANIIYQDEYALAFRDINPQAPVHFLVIPKQRNGLTRLCKATEANKEQLGHLMLVASKVAISEGLEPGYRVVINDGPQGCQSVYHLHLHVLGGKQLGWPPC